jgi:hypothetical protein
MILIQEAISQYDAAKRDSNQAPNKVMLQFLASIQKVGHDQCDNLKQTVLGNQCAMHPSIPMSCGMIDFSTTVF